MRLISSTALRQYMDHRRETNRSLAAKTDGAARRAIIGHLRSGRRTRCTAPVARAIERALDAPAGSLFTPDHAGHDGRAAA